MKHSLRFRVHRGPFAVAQMPLDAGLPLWAISSSFVSVTRTARELSVVCDESLVPDGIRAQKGWSAVELEGPLDFELTGILASILDPLAEAGIPVFALSTFDTDWVLIPTDRLPSAVQALTRAGHNEI